MASKPPEPPQRPRDGLPRWLTNAIVTLFVLAGLLILVGGAACFVFLAGRFN